MVTGEGRLDAQTSDGKLISAVCTRAAGTPVWAAVGTSMLDGEAASDLGLSGVVALTDITAHDTSRDPGLASEALQQAGRNIAQHVIAHGQAFATE